MIDVQVFRCCGTWIRPAWADDRTRVRVVTGGAEPGAAPVAVLTWREPLDPEELVALPADVLVMLLEGTRLPPGAPTPSVGLAVGRVPGG